MPRTPTRLAGADAEVIMPVRNPRKGEAAIRRAVPGGGHRQWPRQRRRPQTYLATIGLFVLPVSEETGFSRMTVTGAYSVAAVGMAIVARFVDRFAARYILVPGFMLFAVLMAMVGLVPPIAPVYLIPCFFVGFCGAGTAVPATRAVVSWFDNNRALAIGIVTGIIGLGVALAPVLAGALIDSVGWRLAYGFMALIAVVVSVTMAAGPGVL